MKVLMVTPRVDIEHDIFGFIHTWVDELSKRVEHLDVIAFRIGKTKLRNNVNLYSAYSKYRPIKFLKLNKFLLKLVPKADLVFTHMYPWLPIVAAPYAKFFKKPLIMWYAHGHVDLKQRIAIFFSDKAVTSSRKGLRINSNKIIIVGQGIDVNRFRPHKNMQYNQDNGLNIISIGRISMAKGYDVLIEAANLLIKKKKDTSNNNIKITIIGPIYDKDYYTMLKKKIEKYGLENSIKFVGSIPFKEIHKLYRKANLYVSASTTGSLDKTTLEAMATSIPVIVCNEAFLDIFDEKLREKCFFEKGNYVELAKKIEYFMKNEEKELREKLRKIVIENHSIDNLIKNLVKVFEDVVK